MYADLACYKQAICSLKWPIIFKMYMFTKEYNSEHSLTSLLIWFAPFLFQVFFNV